MGFSPLARPGKRAYGVRQAASGHVIESDGETEAKQPSRQRRWQPPEISAMLHMMC